MRIHLTERALARFARATEGPTELRDAGIPSLCARHAGPGRLAFSISYRPPGVRGRGGRKRRLTLGHWPAPLSLALARERAVEALRELEAGLDPAVTAHERELAGLTVGGLVELYLLDPVVSRAATFRERRRVLLRDVVAEVGDRPAGALRRGEVASLLDAIVRRGAPVQANRVRSVLHALFAWALERELVAANPVAAVRRPVREQSRDRVLGAAELRAAWEAFEELSPSLCLSLRFRLATLQRGGEVATLAPVHVDGEWWTIPKALAKMKRAEHRVPLSGLALALLREAAELGVSSRSLCFPGASGAPFDPASASHAVRRLCRLHGWEPWTPHDLRRTGATLLTAAGVSELAVARLLSHTIEGGGAAPRVTGVYVRYGFDAEKRRAMVVWGRMLAAILRGASAEAAIAAERERQARAEALDFDDRPGGAAGG